MTEEAQDAVDPSANEPVELSADLDEQAVEEAVARATRQRIPGAFDIAFLSGVEDVTEIVLVRHGQQDYDVNGPVSELIDPPLSELGRQQARLVGMALSTQRVDHVYASPLQRALDTGAEIARHHRLEPIVLDDLREVGIFRDVPADRTPLDYIGRLALTGTRERMVREKSWDVYPFSESSFEFNKRVINAIEGIIAAHKGDRIVIACHGGVINAYTGYIIGSKYDMFFRPAHTSISIVAAGEHGIRALRSLNDIYHLRNAEGDFASV
jgi:broad specificity phosphatase PhoE